MDPSTPAARRGGDRAPRSRDPVDRRQRPRRRGERHRRVAARAVGARRPLGLRGAADPRRGRRRAPADAEPGRPRGRHAPQRLRLRHEPRLVRAHAAGDRRQARDAAPLPAGAVHRRARDGRHATATSSRPTPTRSTTRSTDQAVGWINDLYGRADAGSVFDARGIPYFNYATYDLFYMGYGDTVPATGFGAAGMTYEKTSGDPRRERVLRAVPDAVDVALAGRARTSRRSSPAGTTAGSRRSARAAPASSSRTRSCSRRTRSSSRCPTSRCGTTSSAPTTRRKAREVQALVRRLQRMDVRVRRLTAAAAGRRLHAVRPRRARTRRCRPAPTWSRWTSARSTGSRRCSTRTPTCRSRTSTTSRRGASRCCSTSRAATPGGGSPTALGAGGAQCRPGRAGRARGRRRGSRCTRCRRRSSRGIESSGWLRWLLDRWGLRVHAT